jgi:hypothetical protein
MKSFSTSALQLVYATPTLQKDPRLGCTAISLATPGGPTCGMLVTWAGDLVAVLGETDPDLRPEESWIVEFGLGPCEPPPGGLFFDSLDEAIRWVEASCRELGRIGLA